MQVDRVQQRAPDVVLLLLVGGVADPHRPRAARSPRGGRAIVLVELALAVEAVHDLQLLLAGGDVGDEVEEVVGLPLEAQRQQRPQHERRVADPAVAVVPVALALRRLGQRGGRGGQQRAAGRVGEALERQRRALQEGCATGGRGSCRGRASAASGGRSRPAGRRPRRCPAAARARTTTARSRRSRPPSSCGARSPARPRTRAAGRWSASARRCRPSCARCPRGSRRPCSATAPARGRSRTSARSRAAAGPRR